jgi:uncharacterized LabA/DUF88 family protein
MTYIFIDGQNLYLGTRQDGWNLDFSRFYIYLKDKFRSKKIYYFIGYFQDENVDMYNNLSGIGYEVIFKDTNSSHLNKKRGNVDIDIVFEIMKTVIESDPSSKIILVSGDGDYKKVVDYLIFKNKFLKVLFPNRKFASSVYNPIGNEYFVYLSNQDVKAKIELRKLANEKGA